MVQVPDLEFKIVIDAYRTDMILHPDPNVATSIDVTVVGRPKNIPQSAVDDGFGNVTLNDLLDRDFYNTIPLKYQTAFFHRTNQSFQLQGHNKGPISDSDFRPFAFFDGGNHNQSPYSPNHPAVAPIITSWQQTIYQAPEPAIQITVVQDMPAGITTTFDMSGLFNNPIDYSKTRSWITHGTKLLFSAELSDGSPLPDWMTLDNENELLTMTPPSGTVGNPYLIDFTAMNSLGMTGSNSVPFQVATAPADNSTGTDITFPDGTDPSSLVLDPDGTLTIVNPPASPTWKANPIQIPAGKKLVVKWEYEPLDNGELMMESDGSYNNALAILVGEGDGSAWKYFQNRRPVGQPAIGYFRYAGSGLSPTPNTDTANIDMLSSEFRLEVTHNGSLQTTKMKIRPVDGSTSFDELTDESQTGNGYFYEEETFSTTSDEVNIWMTAQSEPVNDSQGQFRKFDYLKYELVDE